MTHYLAIAVIVHSAVAFLMFGVCVFLQGYWLSEGYNTDDKQVNAMILYCFFWPLAIPLTILYNLGIHYGSWRQRVKRKKEAEICAYYKYQKANEPIDESTEGAGYGSGRS